MRMVVSNLNEGDGVIRRRLADDGFLLFRSVVADNVVLELDGAARRAAAETGLDRRSAADGDLATAINKSIELLRRSVEFQRARKSPALRPLLETIGAAGHHPASHSHFARFVPPGDAAGRMSAHQDQHYVPRPFNFVTLWVPIVMPPAGGGIAVAGGSHMRGPVKHVNGRVAITPPTWHVATYRPGDVVVLGAYTVHKSLANHSSAVRVSADFRYVLKRVIHR